MHRSCRCHFWRSSDFRARDRILSCVFHLFLRYTVSGAQHGALSAGSTS